MFYLLQGAMDSDDSWSTVGRAGFILDGQDALPLGDFVAEFQQDIKSYIDSHYPILGGSAHTASATQSRVAVMPGSTGAIT